MLLFSISGFFIISFSLFFIPIKQFKLPLVLFSAGTVILLLQQDVEREELLGSILIMRSMIGLIMIIPMIGWVLNFKPYVEHLMEFVRKRLNNGYKLYSSIVAFTQINAFFLSFGTIPFTYQIAHTAVKNRTGGAWEYFKGTSILRGFALYNLWGLSSSSFIFTVETLNASLAVAMAQGLFMAAIGMFLAALFFHFERKRYNMDFSAAIQKDFSVTVSDPDGKKRC